MQQKIAITVSIIGRKVGFETRGENIHVCLTSRFINTAITPLGFSNMYNAEVTMVLNDSRLSDNCFSFRRSSRFVFTL